MARHKPQNKTLPELHHSRNLGEREFSGLLEKFLVLRGRGGRGGRGECFKHNLGTVEAVVGDRPRFRVKESSTRLRGRNQSGVKFVASSIFLVACTRLYKSLCPTVGLSITSSREKQLHIGRNINFYGPCFDFYLQDPLTHY